MKPIIFSGPSIQAIMDGRKTQTKLYAKNGDSPLSKNHLVNRMLNGISIDSSTGCWNWIKTRNNHGYGTLTINGRCKYAHRLSYELFNGEITSNLHVLHGCDNPACVNPEHLHLGTRSDNMRECYERGRSNLRPISLPGEKNGQSKLTRGDVRKIRELLSNGEKQIIIARMFGISQTQVSNIKRRVRWSEANYILN